MCTGLVLLRTTSRQAVCVFGAEGGGAVNLTYPTSHNKPALVGEACVKGEWGGRGKRERERERERERDNRHITRHTNKHTANT